MKHINTPLDFGLTTPRKLSLLTQIKVFFGGALFQVGAVFFWFGLPFSLVFVLDSEVVNLLKFDGAWQSSSGALQEIEETNSSVNGESIYKYYFTYNVGGQSYQGYSSAVYKSEYHSGGIGMELPIEYKEGDVNRARIVGMRQKTFSAWIALVLLFPLIGGTIYFLAIISNYKALQLLKRGKVAQGRFLRVTDTGGSINEEPVYKYEFAFEVDGRSYVAIAKTHLTAVLEDEDTELILYDKNNPEKNIVYDSISSINKLDSRGNVPKAGIGALTSTITTLLGIVITGLVILVYL